jgi:cytochrome c oxidase subunit II
VSAGSRRRALRRLGGWAIGFGAAASGVVKLHAQEAAGRIIEIEARRFAFTPAEITAKQGEVVTLALKAIDFTHGFSVPDLNVRTDLMPGRVVPLRLQLDRPGRYAFLCDNFCGDDHEQMNGLLVVQA